MPFYVVQPWGHDRYRQATVTSTHDTADDAYARLDAISAKLQRDATPVRPRAPLERPIDSSVLRTIRSSVPCSTSVFESPVRMPKE